MLFVLSLFALTPENHVEVESMQILSFFLQNKPQLNAYDGKFMSASLVLGGESRVIGEEKHFLSHRRNVSCFYRLNVFYLSAYDFDALFARKG